MRSPLALLAPLYHALPEGVRYSLRPLNALDELSTFLPASGRVGMQPIVGGLRSLTAMLRGQGRLVRLSGVSAMDGSPLRALVDLGSACADVPAALRPATTCRSRYPVPRPVPSGAGGRE